MFKKSMICILSLSVIHVIHTAESQSEKDLLEKHSTAWKAFLEACPNGMPLNIFAPSKSIDCYRKYRALKKLEKENKPLLDMIERKNACAHAGMVYQVCLMSYPPSSGEEAMEKCAPQYEVVLEACKKARFSAKDDTDKHSETNS